MLDFVKENERLESIGEDVVGWWAKASWQPGLAEKLHIKDVCSGGRDEINDSTQGSMLLSRDASPGTGSEQRGHDAGSSTELVEAEDAGSFTVPPMLAFIHSKMVEAEAIIRRVDTAQLLLATSLQLAKLPSLEETGSSPSSPYAHARKVAYPEGVKSRTTITKQDSLIAENVTVEEKTSIKESCVGANCQIKEGAKLSQCLLMEGAVVGKNCKLTKCILGKRCVIGDGCILTDCEVQENLFVEAKSKDPYNSQ